MQCFYCCYERCSEKKQKPVVGGWGGVESGVRGMCVCLREEQTDSNSDIFLDKKIQNKLPFHHIKGSLSPVSD